ncbi:MAG: hypothetical protein ISS78_10245 [Phycisphaerae bacterium]|nr:hypothetical protein [Phycisphaerae bacterium]
MLKRVGVILVFVGLAVVVAVEFPWVGLPDLDPPRTAKEEQERHSEYQSYKVKKYAGRILAVTGCAALGLHWYTSRRQRVSE